MFFNWWRTSSSIQLLSNKKEQSTGVHAKPWISCRLSEKSQTQKATCYDLYDISKKAKLGIEIRWMVTNSCKGLGEYTDKKSNWTSGDDGYVLYLNSFYKSKIHGSTLRKRINFAACKLYLRNQICQINYKWKKVHILKDMHETCR